MPLPVKIDPCPIADTGFEVRFTPAMPPSAVFGIVYTALKNTHPSEVEQLPILQLPDSLLDQDPNLMYRPHHQISNDQFTVQIGPRILVISSKSPYPGWDVVREEVTNCLKAIVDAGVIKTIERMGMRYVNLFVGDVTEQLTIKVSAPDDLKLGAKSMRVEVKHLDLLSSVSIHTEFGNAGETKDQIGTVVDIDTYILLQLDPGAWGYADLLEQMHASEKSLFFSLLKLELLNQLNPIYDEQ